MNFQQVNIRDYPDQPIRHFAQARNYFLKQLPDNQYILFVEDDEEVPEMLLDYVRRLKPEYPYYNIRRLNLVDNHYVPIMNPFHVAKLCSNRMRFIRSIHEVPEDTQHRGWQKRCGWIDIPTIHNQIMTRKNVEYAWRGGYPTSPWFQARVQRPLQAILKIREILRGW